MSQDNGARLQIWQDVNGDNQLWVVEEVKPKKTSPKKRLSLRPKLLLPKRPNLQKRPLLARLRQRKPQRKRPKGSGGEEAPRNPQKG